MAAYASPVINIGSMHDYMSGKDSALLKRVRNSGTSTAFVKIDVFEIVYQKDGSNIEQAIAGVDKGAKHIKYKIASPSRLIIPQDGMQASRFLHLGDRTNERYYRVRFSPVVPDKDNLFGLSDADVTAYENNITAGVNILTGYGGIVIVRPENTHFDTKIDGGENLTVTNNGNSTIVLESFARCEKNICADGVKEHVLPGKSKIYKKGENVSYKFSLVEGENKKEMAL